MKSRKTPLVRNVLSWVLLVLFCVTAPLALLTGWARMTVLAAQEYMATVGELADEAQIQEAVTQAITAKVGAAIRGENPTATQALLAGAALVTTADAARDVVSSAEFANVWREDNRALHTLLTATTPDPESKPAVLDLSPLLPLMLRELASRKITLPEGVTIKPEDLRITLFDGHLVDRVRQFVQRLDLAAWSLLLLTFVTVVLSVAVAPDILAALERAGFGLAIAMVVLIAVLVIGPAWAAGSAQTGGGVISAILDAVTQGLRLATVGLALVGLVLGSVFAGLRALRRTTVSRGAGLE